MTSRSHEAESYAGALRELGRATGLSAVLERELVAVLDLLDRNQEICEFLSGPRVPPEGKVAALTDLLKARIHPVLLYFLLMLVEQGDWSCLGEVARLVDRGDRPAGERVAELTTAAPLTDEQVAAIEAAVSERVHRAVRFRVRVDPRVIGGVSAKVDDMVFDGTVAHRLEQVREALAKA